MRKSLIAVLCGALVLAIAGVASAAITQTFELKFTTKKPKASTGFVSKLATSDPAAANQKPPAVSKMVITFPKGTKLDTSVFPVCKASLAALSKKGGEKLCRSSQIGTGSAIVNARPFLSAPVNAKVFAFNIKGGIIFLAQNSVQPQAFSGKVKGNVLTVTVPPLPPPTDPAVLTSFTLNVKAKSVKVGKGRRAKRKNYATTPSSCPKSGKWTTNAKFTYTGAAGKTVKWDTPCSKR